LHQYSLYANAVSVEDFPRVPFSHKAHSLYFLHRELRNGVVLLDEKNNEVGISKKAAFVGISAVLVSRIAMAMPGMSE